jgi:hypothetical protein
VFQAVSWLAVTIRPGLVHRTTSSGILGGQSDIRADLCPKYFGLLAASVILAVFHNNLQFQFVLVRKTNA